MSERRIEEGVRLALAREDFCDYAIVENGKTSNDQGYLGNISFVTVDARDKNGRHKKFDLVIKASKESKTLRNQTPIRETFVKEIFIYDQVLKCFNDLQHDMDSKNLLNFMPYCYSTQILNDSEILVFENLKKQGYDSWDRKISMTHEHIKLLLEAYGKWHGFSYALRRNRRDIFEELIKDNINIFPYFFKKVNMMEMTLELFEQGRDGSLSPDEKHLLDKLQFTMNDAMYIFTDLFFEDLDYSVISHGDCWSNNFLFKFDNDPKKPTSVQILDWQCSGLSSPVLDLSHLIYSCCDTEKYKDVSELLKIYYNSLKKCVEALGCESEDVFPYRKLVEHWKRFSRYGIFIQAFVLKFSMCEAEDAPDFAEAAEQGKEFLDNFNIKISNPDAYYKRVRANLMHYVENLSLNE